MEDDDSYSDESSDQWEGMEEASDDENLASLEEDSMEGGDASEVIPFSTDKKAKDGFKYECLPAEQILQLMSKTISEVNDILNIDPTTLRIVLAHYKWDRERLLERYYEFEGNPEKIFKESHVVNPFRSSSKKPTKSSSSLRNSTCDICLTGCLQNYMTGLACGHVFCKECWQEYLTVKIMDYGMSQTISCPAYGCDITVDDIIVMNLLSSKRVKQKYIHLITNTFVQCNSQLKWCPAPDCHHVVRVNFGDARPVKCDCGKTFCFNCSEHWHDPVLCSYLKKWIKKCDDDSETSNWIAVNTKECPKCQVIIEKNGGCNHMICRNVSCRYEFCWTCLGPWTPHGSSWYTCNRYNADDAKKARDSQEVSRQALQRYLFYFSRYMNHLQSLRFENKLYAQIAQKMDDLQQLNMSWIEVQFLKRAVDILCQCRNTLRYTYVFAFYLKKNNQSIIFEGNQADLEKATEMLSDYLERNIDTDSQQEIKQKVQDKSRYCDTRRKVLLSHVYEGYEKDTWQYTDT